MLKYIKKPKNGVKMQNQIVVGGLTLTIRFTGAPAARPRVRSPGLYGGRPTIIVTAINEFGGWGMGGGAVTGREGRGWRRAGGRGAGGTARGGVGEQ